MGFRRAAWAFDDAFTRAVHAAANRSEQILRSAATQNARQRGATFTLKILGGGGKRREC